LTKQTSFKKKKKDENIKFICCICDEAEKRWTDIIEEVKAVSERDRKW